MAKAWTKKLFENKPTGEGLELANELLEDLRPQDDIDLEASGSDKVFTLVACLRLSEEAWVYRNDKSELLGIVGKTYPTKGAPGRSIWMLATNKVNDGYVRTLLMREAKELIGYWVKQHGLLYNAVYEKNKTSINYMTKVLGARWLPEPIVFEGRRFLQFYINGEGKAWEQR